jgi:hypothetical protein
MLIGYMHRLKMCKYANMLIGGKKTLACILAEEEVGRGEMFE